MILIKTLFLSKVFGSPILFSEFPDKGWKLGSVVCFFFLSYVCHEP